MLIGGKAHAHVTNLFAVFLKCEIYHSPGFQVTILIEMQSAYICDSKDYYVPNYVTLFAIKTSISM